MQQITVINPCCFHFSVQICSKSLWNQKQTNKQNLMKRGLLSGKTGHRKWLSFSPVLYPSPGDAASQQNKIIIWRKWFRLRIPRLRKNCFNIDTLKTNNKKMPYRHFCGLTETMNSIPPAALLWELIIFFFLFLQKPFILKTYSKNVSLAHMQAPGHLGKCQ